MVDEDLVLLSTKAQLLISVLYYSSFFNQPFYISGSMDHMMSRSAIVSATNKDSINISRCTALWDLIRFNLGSWGIALYMLCLCYAIVLQDAGWKIDQWPENLLDVLLFSAPAAFLAICAFIVPIILNPFVLGWPFNPPLCRRYAAKDGKDDEDVSPPTKRRDADGNTVDLQTFMNADKKLDQEIGRVQQRPDVEIGSIATKDFGRSSVVGGATFAMNGQRRRSPQNQNISTKDGRTKTDRQFSGRARAPGDRSGGSAFQLAMI